MSEIVYLLKSDGVVDELSIDESSTFKSFAGEADCADITQSDVQSDPLVINFNGVADGRGFSLVKFLRAKLQVSGKIYAGGFINPDQLSFAFQTGLMKPPA